MTVPAKTRIPEEEAGATEQLDIEAAAASPEGLPVDENEIANRTRFFSPLERMIVALHLNGNGHARISQLTGIPVGQIGRLLRDPDLEPIKAGVHALHTAEIAALTRPAVEAMRTILSTGSQAMRLKAADMVFSLQSMYKGADNNGDSAEDVIQRILEVV